MPRGLAYEISLALKHWRHGKESAPDMTMGLLLLRWVDGGI